MYATSIGPLAVEVAYTPSPAVDVLYYCMWCLRLVGKLMCVITCGSCSHNIFYICTSGGRCICTAVGILYGCIRHDI